MGFIIIPFKPEETLEEWERRVIEDDAIRKWEDCACAADPDEKIYKGSSFWRFAGWAAE
jgi:hypothetical protein